MINVSLLVNKVVGKLVLKIFCFRYYVFIFIGLLINRSERYGYRKKKIVSLMCMIGFMLAQLFASNL